MVLPSSAQTPSYSPQSPKNNNDILKKFSTKIKHVKELKNLFDLVQKTGNQAAPGTILRNIFRTFKTPPVGRNKFEQYLIRNYILTTIKKNIFVNREEQTKLDVFLSNEQENFDKYLHSPTKSFTGSTYNRDLKAKELRSLENSNSFSFENIEFLTKLKNNQTVHQILSESDDSSVATTVESTSSTDNSTTTEGLIIPEGLTEVAKENSKFNLNDIINNKKFTITVNSDSYDVKAWALKEDEIGSGSYGRYFGDTFKNLTKQETEFLISLNDKQLKHLNQYIKNPKSNMPNFKSKIANSIISKAYARKKHLKNEKNIQTFIKDIKDSDLFNLIGTQFKNRDDYETELNNHNIMITTEKTGKKNKQKDEKKTYALAARAQSDLKKLHVEFEPLFKDLTKSLHFLKKHNLVHLDIKSANMLIHNNSFKLTDFGLVTKEKTKITILHNYKPSEVWYYPPEMWSKNPIATHKVDVWQAGLLLLKKITKNDSYVNNTLIPLLDAYKSNNESNKDRYSEAWNKKVNSLVTSSKIPEKYKNILIRMLDSDPLKRPSALTKDTLE